METGLTSKRIAQKDWDVIKTLQIADNQKGYIESSEHCLQDALNNAYDMEWHFYGIYLQDKLIGFAMHGIQYVEQQEEVWLDRFMIDQVYQNKGYGKQGMKIIIEQLYEEYHCSILYLSVIQENKKAISMYQSLGFIKTKQIDDNNEQVYIRFKEN